MPVAIPRKPRPHHEGTRELTEREQLKQLLVQQIVSGDTTGAESTRRKLQTEGLKQRVRDLERSASRPAGASTAHWVDDDGSEESIELVATPEAKAYFEQVMSKEAAN